LVRPLGVQEHKERTIIEEHLAEQRQRRKLAREELDKKERITRDIQNEDYMMKKENEQNEEREILDKKSLALRKYLDVNLVPILSEGIAELLHSFPKDPVDFLAEFMFKNSLKVPNPDPSTFDF
jgi:adenylate kinase